MLRPLFNTTKEVATIETNTPDRQILPGDFVYVWDGAKNDYLWQLVKDVKVDGARRKINVDGTSFFFDEALVAAVAYLTGEGVVL